MGDISDIAPLRGYAICGDARCGSVFLSHLLRSTGVLGRPSEFFHDPKVARQVVRDSAALGRLAREAATPNGVYGLKVFAPHFDQVVAARWAERLPRLGFVFLTRRDLLGQALSLVRALQSGQYKADQPRHGAPRYDGAAIADSLARLAYGRARWQSWFARNGIDPLRLVYEDVVAAPQAAVDAVARLVDVEEPARADLSLVEVRVQRDALTEAWRERFLRERGDRAYLDGGRLFSRFRRGGAFARLFLGPR